MRRNIALLVPCYNEEAVIEKFYRAATETISGMTDYQFSFLFIDDGSVDNTLSIIRDLAANDSRVYYVSLSRNFGKESAMLAGFDYFEGDALIIMDADLQDPPGIIPELIREWEQGYHDVYARRQSRDGENWFKKLSSKIYYRLLSKMSDIPVMIDTGDFRLLDKKCVDALKEMRETQRYTKGLYSWVGFSKKEVLYDRAQRAAGETHWSLPDLFRLAIDGITSFSTVPLQMSTWLGIAISFSAFLYMIFVVAKTLLYGDAVAGYPSMMAVLLFVSGMQLFALGIIGEYVGKTFSESKRRPVYFVAESYTRKDRIETQ